MNKNLVIPTLAAALAIASSASAQAIIRTFTATEDTYVRADAPNSAFGADSAILVGGHIAGTGDFTSFYKFENVNLSGITSISSVVLRLTSINQGGVGSVNINLYQFSVANSDWKEGTTGVVPTDTTNTGATFNNKAGQGATTLAWAGGSNANGFVSGTDYVGTILGNYTGATNTATGGQQFDLGNAALSSLITASIGSTSATFNFVILDQTSGANFLRIASSENTTYSAPQLIITAIPEPSSFAALAGLGALGMVGLRRRRRA